MRGRAWLLIGIVVCGVPLAAFLGSRLMYHAILWAWTGQTHDIPMNSARPFEQVPEGVTVQRLAGHKGATRALAFFPDGRYLASGGDDHVIRIWDLERHTARAVEGHDGPVYALAISPDGKRMLSAGGDLIVRLWDVRSGKVLALLEGHTAAIRAVAFLPDDRAITASDDCTLRVWNLREEQQLKQLEGHEDIVQSMSVSPNGTRAASIDPGGLVNLWDLDRGDRLWTFRLPFDVVPWLGRVLPKVPPNVILSPDARTLLTLFGGNEAARFAAWDVASHQRVSDWDGIETAERIALSGDGRHLLAILGSRVSVYAIHSLGRAEFDAPTYTPSRATTPPQPSCAALSFDGSSLAIGLMPGAASPSFDPRAPGEILVYERPR